MCYRSGFRRGTRRGDQRGFLGLGEDLGEAIILGLGVALGEVEVEAWRP